MTWEEFQFLRFKLLELGAKTVSASVLYRIGDLISRYICRRNKTELLAVKDNLRVILGKEVGEADIERQAVSVYRHFSRSLVEFFGGAAFSGEFIDEHVRSTGVEHLDDAVREGKGVVLPTGHLSNWELLGAVVARFGYKVNAFAQFYQNRKLNELFMGRRRALGYNVIPTDAIRKAVEILRRGELLGVLADRTMGKPGVPVEFFGREARFSASPARLAIRTGALIVPAVMVRERLDRYVAVFGRRIDVPADGAKGERVRIVMQQVARFAEKYVRRYPSQWPVFYRYWEPGAERAFLEDLERR